MTIRLAPHPNGPTNSRRVEKKPSRVKKKASWPPPGPGECEHPDRPICGEMATRTLTARRLIKGEPEPRIITRVRCTPHSEELRSVLAELGWMGIKILIRKEEDV